MINKITRKSFTIRYSGRSSDYISPSFGFGCLYKCGYCYMRRHQKEGLNIATNIGDILTAINTHAYAELMFQNVDKPNQTDSKYITYDISCNEDFALHHKYYDWKRIFEFFKIHEIAKATLATKCIPSTFLSYNPEQKVRIRFSLMPQEYSSVLEPNTSMIIDRINAVNIFIEAGYEVHLNFSPVIFHKNNSLNLYKDLFKQVDNFILSKNKPFVQSEVIFLTHNESMHLFNAEHSPEVEELIWAPYFQEEKISQYGGANLRYKKTIKSNYINQFKKIHNEIIPWNNIRYIF